jgi:hypothetical protein
MAYMRRGEWKEEIEKSNQQSIIASQSQLSA